MLKRRLVGTSQKVVLNPLVKLAFGVGLPSTGADDAQARARIIGGVNLARWLCVTASGRRKRRRT